MSKILTTQTTSTSHHEIWDGEYNSDAGKWLDRASKESSVTDSEWEWGQVFPDWLNKFETFSIPSV